MTRLGPILRDAFLSAQRPTTSLPLLSGGLTHDSVPHVPAVTLASIFRRILADRGTTDEATLAAIAERDLGYLPPPAAVAEALRLIPTRSDWRRNHQPTDKAP